jgi:hypothetical protein
MAAGSGMWRPGDFDGDYDDFDELEEDDGPEVWP